MREHTAIIRPPRALWVPFVLGRPLGAPNDPEFQGRVLAAALGLLERPTGPVLEDFPEDAPAAAADDEPTILACPVPRRGEGDAAAGPRGRLLAEIAYLRPWFELGRTQRGRTTFGVSGLEPEAAASLLADWIERGDDAGISSDRLKLAIDDLRAYCLEAGGAQPGAGAGGKPLERWYWWETAIGQALREAHPWALESADPAVRLMARVMMIPVAQKTAP